MTEEAFVDSGAFIAFLDRGDHSYQVVRTLFSKPRRLSTSVLVIAETYGWFLSRFDEETARRFRQFLASLSTKLTVLDAALAHQEKVWRKLDLLRGADLSYVDASCLVWMEERKIRTVWGTDRHLAVEGATVIPGPPV